MFYSAYSHPCSHLSYPPYRCATFNPAIDDFYQRLQWCCNIIYDNLQRVHGPAVITPITQRLPSLLRHLAPTSGRDDDSFLCCGIPDLRHVTELKKVHTLELVKAKLGLTPTTYLGLRTTYHLILDHDHGREHFRRRQCCTKTLHLQPGGHGAFPPLFSTEGASVIRLRHGSGSNNKHC